MNAIRKISKIVDKKVIVDIPEDFSEENVEIIILPYTEKEQDFFAAASGSSLKNIWDNQEDDVYEKLL
jgi:hypothetical protein